jgi:hypothetical protein
MWQTVVNKYGSNTHVYFEIFNEPHGYSLTDWTTIFAKWLSRYPTVPQGHILIDSTSYATNITGVGAGSDGLALDVGGQSKANGAALIQWPWNGGTNQQWQLTGVTTGIFKATNRNSGLVMDVNIASHIIQNPWDSSNNNQQWTIVQQ